MTAAALVTATAALVIFGYGPVLLLREHRARKAAAARRAEEKRLADAEWEAVLAAAATPIYERLCFERWEADL